MATGKVIGKVEVSIGKVKFVDVEGNLRDSGYENLMYEGEQIYSEDPSALFQIKYLALPEATAYDGVFRVLADGSVISGLDGNENLFGDDIDLMDTAAGDGGAKGSSAFLEEVGEDDGADLLGFGRGADDTGYGQGITGFGIEPDAGDQSPPIITSDSDAVFDENGTGAVMQITADDASAVIFTINGLDSGLFTINPLTGVITFNDSPDYETPLDIGGDNEYNFYVTVTDALGNYTTQLVSINVNNVNEAPVAVDDFVGYGEGDGGALSVGYYDMSAGQGVQTQVESIETAGHNAVRVDDLSDIELAGLNVLYVQDGYGNRSEYLAQFSEIHDAVFNDGLSLIFHDRVVDGASIILPGGVEIVTHTSYSAEIEITEGGVGLEDGLAGEIDDDSLDGGTWSNHGYADLDSLPEGAIVLMTNGNPNQVVTFTYDYGEGTVTYSTIPLDYYLSGSGPATVQDNMEIYAANLVEDIANAMSGNIVYENDTIIIDVLANDTDVDADDDPSNFILVSLEEDANPAFSIVDNKLVFTPGEAFDYLAVGQSTEITVVYTMSDDEGLESSATVTLKITGSNDQPTVSIVDDIEPVHEALDGLNMNIFVNQLVGEDVDDGDTLTYHVDDPVATVTDDSVIPLGLSATVEILNEDTGEFQIVGDFNALALGETATVTFEYYAVDNNEMTGNANHETSYSEPQLVTVTIMGTNDQPEISDIYVGGIQLRGGYDGMYNGEAIYETHDTDEGSDGDTKDDAALVFTGTINTVTDDDVTDEHTYETRGVVYINGEPAEGVSATIAFNEESGEWEYTIEGDFNYLDRGEPATITFDYVAIDDSDAGLGDEFNESSVSEPATITLTLTGTNDQPTVVDVTNVVSEESLLGFEDGLPVPFEDFRYEGSVADAVSDDDNSDGGDDTHTFAIDEGTLTLSITTANQAFLSMFDIDDLESFESFIEGITGGNLDMSILNEDANPDVADSVTLTTLEIPQYFIEIMQQYGILNIEMNADGTYSVQSPLFNMLGAHDSVTLGFDYRATDNAGVIGVDGINELSQSEAATVTLTIEGTNDQPVAMEIDRTRWETHLQDNPSEDALFRGHLHGSDEDLLDNFTMTYHGVDADSDGVIDVSTVSPMEIGTVNSVVDATQTVVEVNENGVFSVTNPTFDALGVGEIATVTFSYYIDDGSGATDESAISDDQTVTLTIRGTNDQPVVESVNVGMTLIAESQTEGNLGVLLDGISETGESSATFGQEQVSKTYDLGSEFAGTTVTISFDIFERGTWDGDGTWNAAHEQTVESLLAYVNGAEVVSHVMGLDGIDNNSDDGGEIVSGSAGTWNQTDLHHFTFEALVDENGQITLGFGSTLHEGLANESFTIDNLSIVAGRIIYEALDGRTVYEDTLPEVMDDDVNDTHTYQIIPHSISVDNPLVHGLDVDLDPNTGEYTMSGNFNALAVGEIATVTFMYRADDGSTYPGFDESRYSDGEMVTIVVTGTNDQPVVRYHHDMSDEALLGSQTFDGQLSLHRDVDDSDTHTFEIRSTNQNTIAHGGYEDDGTPNTLTEVEPGIYAKLISSSDALNSLTLESITVDSDGAFHVTGDFNALAAGETATVRFRYVAVDDSGAGAGDANNESDTSNSKMVELTIVGTNDIPVVTSVDTDYVEQDGGRNWIMVDAAASVVDVDSGATFQSVVISMDSEDYGAKLLFTSTTPAFDAIDDGLKIVNQDGAEFTANGAGHIWWATGTILTITKADGTNLTDAEVETIMQTVKFSTGDRVPSDAHDIDVTFSVMDDMGGIGESTVTIDITGTNDTPIFTSTFEDAGATALLVNEDEPLVVQNQIDLGLKYSDNSGDGILTLSVDNGVLNIDMGSIVGHGANMYVISGNGTDTVTITGQYHQINGLLDGANGSSITYQGNPDYYGGDTLHVDYNDNGDLGLAPTSNSLDIAIEVDSVPDFVQWNGETIDHSVDSTRVYEVGIDDAADDSESSTRAFKIEFGDDLPGSVLFADTNVAPVWLTSGGDAVSYVVTNGGLTLTALAGGETVFTLVSNGDTPNTYTMTMERAIDHRDPGQETNFGVRQWLSFDYEASDSDGDAINGSLAVGIYDDVPVAVNDTDTAQEDVDTVVDGNVLANDTQGADGAEVSSVGVQVGTYGSVEFFADGHYIYTLNNASNEVQSLGVTESDTDKFTYTIVDGDGDESEATLTVTVNGANDQPVVENINVGMTLVSENFESGATGWSNNSIADGGAATNFLGRFGEGDTVSKEFDFGDEYAGKTVTIAFDMYEIDSWDGAAPGYQNEGEEAFKVTMNGDEYSYIMGHTGRPEDITDGGTPINNIFGSWADESHHIEQEVVLDSEGKVSLVLTSTLHQSIGDESWGIDNLTIVAGETIYESMDDAGSPLTDDVLTTFSSTIDTVSDVDATDTHIYQLDTDAVVTDVPAGVVITDLSATVDENGDYSVSGNFNQLAAGETATVTFTYVAIDDSDDNLAGDSGNYPMPPNESDTSEPATVTLTITGTNDQPIVQGVSAAVVDSGAITLNGNTTTSVDYWNFTHTGGELTVDTLTEMNNNGNPWVQDGSGVYNDLNGDGVQTSLDVMVRVYELNTDGSRGALVGTNDDSNNPGADGSLWNRDSYLSLDLASGEYQLVVGAWNLSEADVNSGANDIDNANWHYEGPYQISLVGADGVQMLDQNVVFEAESGNTRFENDLPEVIDADANDSHDYSIVGGSVTVSDPSITDFTVTVDVNGHYVLDGDFNSLAVGQRATVTFQYTADDGTSDANGEPNVSEPATVSIVVVGTNDAPVAVADQIEAGVDAGVVVTGLFASGSEVNLLDGVTDELITTKGHYYFDHHSMGYTGYNYMGTSTDGGTNDSGNHHWFVDHGINTSGLRGGIITFSDGTQAIIDAASNGVSRDTDGNGTDDYFESAYIYYKAYDSLDMAPLTVDENGAALVVDVLANDTDVDNNDNPATFSLDNVSTADGGSVSIVNNKLVFDPDGDFEHLAEGETATVVVDYTMSDDSGAASSSTATIVVTGTDDAPVVTLETVVLPNPLDRFTNDGTSATVSNNWGNSYLDLDRSDHTIQSNRVEHISELEAQTTLSTTIGNYNDWDGMKIYLYDGEELTLTSNSGTNDYYLGIDDDVHSGTNDPITGAFQWDVLSLTTDAGQSVSLTADHDGWYYIGTGSQSGVSSNGTHSTIVTIDGIDITEQTLSVSDVDGGSIDLAALVASVTPAPDSLDEIELSGTTEISISIADVIDVTDGDNELLITSVDNVNDTITLDANITVAVDQSAAPADHTIYEGTSGTETILLTIEDTITVEY